jgi:hypothetical protein
MKQVSTLVLLSLSLISSRAAVPTAIFHGMGDACHHRGMKQFTSEISEKTGAYAACVEVGSGSMTSLFENFETQGE